MNQQTPAEPLMWSIKELQRQSGKSKSTIFKAIRKGDLPAYKIGRSTGVTPTDGRSWLMRQRVVPKKP